MQAKHSPTSDSSMSLLLPSARTVRRTLLLARPDVHRWGSMGFEIAQNNRESRAGFVTVTEEL